MPFLPPQMSPMRYAATLAGPLRTAIVRRRGIAGAGRRLRTGATYGSGVASTIALRRGPLMTEYLLTLAADPAAWVALATLIAMEIVLGIDNLIFIAILTNKLPEAVRGRARR